jgi:hypothetical protein
MIAETFLAIYFTPMFFVTIRKLTQLRSRKPAAELSPKPAPSPAEGGH